MWRVHREQPRIVYLDVRGPWPARVELGVGVVRRAKPRPARAYFTAFPRLPLPAPPFVPHLTPPCAAASSCGRLRCVWTRSASAR